MRLHHTADQVAGLPAWLYMAHTLRGVMADNTFHNCNVKSGGNIRQGSMGGVGECYHGASPMFFTEFRANTMDSSDGISLADGFEHSSNAEWQCRGYRGPWVAWSTIRNNTLAGISDAARNISAGSAPMCAAVTVFGGGSRPTGYTSDVVAEQNVFRCPPEGNSSIKYHLMDCQHCTQRY